MATRYLMALVLGSISVLTAATTSHAQTAEDLATQFVLDANRRVAEQAMPDWRARTAPQELLIQDDGSENRPINDEERALIVKAMEVLLEREPSRKELTIGFLPTLERMKAGGAITRADFIVFQGSLMMAQRDMQPEENKKLNDLRHRLYKAIAAMTIPKQ